MLIISALALDRGPSLETVGDNSLLAPVCTCVWRAINMLQTPCIRYVCGTSADCGSVCCGLGSAAIKIRS